MKRSTLSLLVTLPLWLLFWTLLAGAEGSCFGVQTDCDGLDEAACLALEECRAVYTELRYDEALPGTSCMAGDARCIGAEPEFDHCEARPDCASLNEGACLVEGACQAIYGYPEGGMDYRNDTLCADGARCLVPPETFIECLDADADPCAGLVEEECYRRPMCEPIINWGSCENDLCWDGYSYEGCQLRADACRTDEDCYAWLATVDIDVGCPDFTVACEAGQCVVRCEEPTGCQSDADCASGERCEIFCGNGWCDGVCVPVEEGCREDADCPAGQHCAFMPCDCLDGDPDCLTGCEQAGGVCIPDDPGCQTDADCPAGMACEVMCEDCRDGEDCNGECFGQCVPLEPGCTSDADCPEGEICQITEYCTDEYCVGGGVCVPAQTGCQTDDECGPGERCEVRCGNGWCQGVCVGEEFECLNDADCPESFYCEPLPNELCQMIGECPGTCVRGEWGVTEPLQCGQALWELDEAQNPERYYGCYLDCADPTTDCGGGVAEEICKVRAFLLSRDILAHDVRDVRVADEVCASCDCPRGDAVYVLVAPYQFEALLALGFLPYGIL